MTTPESMPTGSPADVPASVAGGPAAAPAAAPARTSAGAVLSHKHRKTKLFMAIGILLGLLVLSLVAPLLAPYDPFAIDLLKASQPPSLEHLAGTDAFGRDVLSRTLDGMPISVLTALLIVLVVTVVGTAIGITAAYFGGWVDSVLMRILDIFLSFPDVLFAIVIAGIMGGGLGGAALALMMVSWTMSARLARALTFDVLSQPYVAAARLSGARPPAIIVQHILPAIAGQLIASATVQVGGIILALSSLSFLGLGAQPPAAEWGSMISQSMSTMQIEPWCIFTPGLFLLLVVVLINLAGDLLRDQFDISGSESAADDSSDGDYALEQSDCLSCAADHANPEQGGALSHA